MPLSGPPLQPERACWCCQGPEHEVQVRLSRHCLLTIALSFMQAHCRTGPLLPPLGAPLPLLWHPPLACASPGGLVNKAPKTTPLCLLCSGGGRLRSSFSKLVERKSICCIYFHNSLEQGGATECANSFRSSDGIDVYSQRTDSAKMNIHRKYGDVHS